MQFAEISTHRPPARAILASASVRHGAWVGTGSACLERLFLLRSAAAPGLHFVGGITAAMGAWCQPRAPMSVGGAGLDLDEAVASCVGEGIERTCQWEQPGDVVESASSVDRSPAQLCSLAEALLKGLGEVGSSGPVDLVRGTVLGDGGDVLIPADWCLRRLRVGPLAVPGAALSTGCAAGATLEDAAARALLELIERDAAGLWWHGGIRGRPIASNTPAADALRRILGEIRAGALGRQTTILDITSDLGVPVVAAVSWEADARGVVCGLACRPELHSAVRAAIIEMAQMELGLELARYKRAHLDNGVLSADDRRHLRRATELHADTCHLLHPDGAARASPSLAPDPDRLGAIARRLRQHGVAAYLVDLSRRGAPLPVVKAIAPRLQQMPGDLVTARLAAARARGGDGQGIPVL